MSPSTRTRRRGAVVIALAVVGAVFFFVPAIAWVGGQRAKPFENRPLAGLPSLSRGWGVFDGLNQWSIDHLPLRDDAVKLRVRIYADVFDQLPPQALATGPVGAGSTGAPAGLAAEANEGLPRWRQAVPGKDGWLFYGQEFVNACRPQARIATVLAGLRRFSDIVRRSGRRLVIVIVPDKSGMEPGKLPGDLPEKACTARAHAARLAALRAARIPGWIDIEARLRRRQRELGAPIYLPRDTHWTQEGALVYAKTMVDALRPGLWESARLVPLGQVPYVGDTAKILGDTTKEYQSGFHVDRPGLPVAKQTLLPAIPPNWKFTQSIVKGAGNRVIGPSTVVYGDSFDLDAGPMLYPFFRHITHLQDLTAGYLADAQPRARQLAVDQIAESKIVVIEQVERTVWGLSFGAVWAPNFLTALQQRLHVSGATGEGVPPTGAPPAPTARTPAGRRGIGATAGLAPPETRNGDVWQWAISPRASMRLSGSPTRARRTFSAQLIATAGRTLTVTVVFPDGSRLHRRVTGSPSPLSHAFALGPAGGTISFSTTAKPSKAPPDPRTLYFQIRNAAVVADR